MLMEHFNFKSFKYLYGFERFFLFCFNDSMHVSRHGLHGRL